MSDRTATQKFEIRNILTGHCEEVLSPIKIDEIVGEIEVAITSGPCARAFGKSFQQPNTADVKKPRR
jgi:hypothetical protein